MNDVHLMLVRVVIGMNLLPSAAVGFVCDKDSFQCTQIDECIGLEQRCDGHIDCLDTSDESNCTAGPVLLAPKSNINLAWLVTPCIFLIGLCYAVGRCIYDGICCNRERLMARMRHMSTDSSSSHQRRSFFPLSIRTSTQLPFFHGGAPGDHPGNQQLLLVHDQSFSIRVAPSGDSSVKLPSYEEATSVPLMTDEELPPYSELEVTSPPGYAVSAVLTQPAPAPRFQPHDRRRHRSQQETSRRNSFSLARRRHRSQETYSYTSLMESDES